MRCRKLAFKFFNTINIPLATAAGSCISVEGLDADLTFVENDYFMLSLQCVIITLFAECFECLGHEI